MAERFRWPGVFVVLALLTALVLPGSVGHVRAQEHHLKLPLVLKHHWLPMIQVSGRVLLEGRDDHSGAIVKLNGVQAAQTNAAGYFAFSWYLASPATTAVTVTAHCPAYLWAQTVLNTEHSLVFDLPDVCLLGGDVAGPASTIVTPTVGCPDTTPVPVPGPPDGEINVFDITLVSLHQGVDSADTQCGPGDPCWGPDPCFPGVPHLGYRADINGDGRVDAQDMAFVASDRNQGKRAPLPWVSCP